MVGMLYVVERTGALPRIHVCADGDGAMALASRVGGRFVQRFQAERIAFDGAQVACEEAGGDEGREVERLFSYNRCLQAIEGYCEGCHSDLDADLAWRATGDAMAAWGDRSEGDVFTARIRYGSGETGEPNVYSDVPMLAADVYAAMLQGGDLDLVGAFVED